MKKLILSLLIFFSVISPAQIQIPQVVGLPSVLNSKADKVTGKSLVADTSIIKLNGIQSGAQVNILEGVQRNGANLPITGKKVNVIVPTTPSEVGAEPANTNIQSHISSISNPHSVTKSQVGLGNVDNTSDINKPISTATQTALDGKQLIGTYATGNGTANGINTGDETLSSIKTKLGAATSVSDGYLKYQDWNTFNSKEPAITKNTGFNKNFGTTTGTVLEGRTFGTAANSSVGDFVQNQNTSAQSANMWINGVGKFETALALNRSSLTAATPLKYSTAGTDDWFIGQSPLGASTKNLSYYSYGLGGVVLDLNQTSGAATFSSTVNSTGFLLNGNNLTSSLSTNYIPKWNGSNFVNSLISDDSNLVYINNTKGIYISGDDPGNSYWLRLNNINGGNQYSILSGIVGEANAGFSIRNITANRTEYKINSNGDFIIPSSTQSTSPTTGALVVGGGIGVGGNGYFAGDVHCGNIRATSSNSNFISSDVGIGYGSYQGYKLAVNGTGYFNSTVTASSFYGSGSNLTGVQLPITLTTNGTSGAATLTGNVLNVPNYGSNATSGTYSPIITLVSGLSSNNSWGATYTKNGNNYHVGTAGVLTTNATGTCAFRFTLPYPITGTFAAIIPHIYGVSGSYIASSWSAGVNSSTIEITFTSSSPTASQFYYNIMIDYY